MNGTSSLAEGGTVKCLCTCNNSTKISTRMAMTKELYQRCQEQFESGDAMAVCV